VSVGCGIVIARWLIFDKEKFETDLLIDLDRTIKSLKIFKALRWLSGICSGSRGL
jgi:hypothetical protein